MIKIAKLYRHPVKSLGSEALERAQLRTGGAMEGDRRWAIAHGNSKWDAARPRWIECGNFLRVTHAPLLARISVSSDAATDAITATYPGDAPSAFDLGSDDGRAALAEWVAPLAGVVDGPFQVVAMPSGAFTDSPDMSPSLKSLSSLRDLGEKLGVQLDPRRFRGNIWIDGLEPWAELGWGGRELRIGGTRLRVTEPIGRCRATMANPETGARDADTIKALKQHFGHTNFGVEVEVIEGGAVSIGDAVEGAA